MHDNFTDLEACCGDVVDVRLHVLLAEIPSNRADPRGKRTCTIFYMLGNVLWRCWRCWKGCLGRGVAKVLVTSSSTILYECRFYVAECCCAVWLSVFSVLVFMFLATQFDSK